ncbi:class I SAM-dependent methyltransferase [Rugosimonospora acidiphila]|uniref:Class I SAM-dependent methyltransferase n=1 Tax=Rugosimonospora acidiphila TaxID=556531 RepID=A0ABP9SS11_9ACTN
MTHRPNTGTGPGPITPDGCPVALYTLLPESGEAEIVHRAIPDGASVLELGCGTGRILRRLAEFGHEVLGVDESDDMLAHATGLTTVRSSIEALALGREFDAVLLASTLVNTPDPAAREAMLGSARRHAARGGCVIIQRHRPEWFDTLEPSTVYRGGIRYTVGEVRRDGPLLSTTIGYRVGDRDWTHTFTTRRLTDRELVGALGDAGFGEPRPLTEDGSWLAAPAG